jgi:MYXO-CTERM domain-containing protein
VLSLGTVAPTSDYSFYSVNAADLIAPSGSAWLEAEVRLVQGGGTAGWWRAPVALVISFANGNTAILELGADEAWLRNDNNGVGATLTGIDTDSSLHLWRLEASGDAAGSWVAAYRDGVQVLGANAVHASAGATLGVAWGDASILAWGSSEWASVRTNMAAVSSVPEPDLAGLWLAGLAGVLAARRRASPLHASRDAPPAGS